MITASASVVLQTSEVLNYWDICYANPQAERDSTMKCNDTVNILPDTVIQVVPALIDLILSVVCVTVILIWFLWLRRKQLLRTRMGKIYKEIGLLLGYLLSYCIHGTIVTSSELSSNNSTIEAITLALYPVTHLVIPISFFVYMCVSIYNGHKRYTSRTLTGTVQINYGTTGLQTSPTSTRVSLPSDTVNHAPNFLSPSGEVSRLQLTTSRYCIIDN